MTVALSPQFYSDISKRFVIYMMPHCYIVLPILHVQYPTTPYFSMFLCANHLMVHHLMNITQFYTASSQYKSMRIQISSIQPWYRQTKPNFPHHLVPAPKHSFPIALWWYSLGGRLYPEQSIYRVRLRFALAARSCECWSERDSCHVSERESCCGQYRIRVRVVKILTFHSEIGC